MAVVERYFERPWIDHKAGYTARNQHPLENMPDYGREIAIQIGVGALMLHFNFTNQQKETLFIRYIQLGIDLYGIVQNGGIHNWVADGGHAGGRKWPILFAGLILDDKGMKDIGNKSGDYLYSNGYSAGNGPDDYIHFGEDDQTFYVTKHPDANPPSGNTDHDIYVPPYAIHGYHYGTRGTQTGTVTVVKGSTMVVGSGTTWTTAPDARMFGISDDGEIWDPQGKAYYMVNDTVIDDTHLELTEPYRGNPGDPDGTVYSNKSYIISDLVYYGHGQTSNYTEAEEYVHGDEQLPEWGIRHANHPYMDNKNWTTPYRLSGTAHAWAGFVLAAHIMHAKTLWNHAALFDYQDRYMEIQKQTVGVGHWTRQMTAFPETMWDTYRINYAPVWTPAPNPIPDPGPVPDPDPDPGINPNQDPNPNPLAGLPDTTSLQIINNLLKKSGDTAIIRCDLKEAGNLSVKIYDANGKEIIVLCNSHQDAGTHSFTWGGRNINGNIIGSGVYIVYMESGGHEETKKIAVIK